MRRIAMWIVAFGLAAIPAMAASTTDNTTDGAKPAATSGNTSTTTSGNDTKSTTQPAATSQPGNTTQPAATNVQPGTLANSADDKKSAVEEELDELRNLIRAQSEQLEEQHKEIEEMKARLSGQPAGTEASSASAPANNSPATAASGSAPANTAAPAGTATVSNASTSTAAVTPAPATPAPQADNEGKPSPLSFKIGSAEFTPGGFMDFTGVFRTTGTGNGIGTSFGGIPLNNNFPTAGLTETRFSAQNSRVSLRVDAPVGGGNVSGYVETDFLGAIAQNANVTSNSDSLRMRLYFVDYRRGIWEILAGQDWSMLTPNRKGISPWPSDIFYSQDMDTNYQVGLTWARQPQFRVVLHPNDNWAFGVSLENADQLVSTAVTTPSQFSSVAGQVDETSSGTLATPPTPNVAPDIILKLANDTHPGGKLFHWELAGLLSEFKLVTQPSVLGTTTAATDTKEGGGAALNLNLELFKNFHLIGNSFYSDGGGRYIFGLGPDLVVNELSKTSPFIPVPLHAASGIGGWEYQATKSFMFYGYYGGAYYDRYTALDPVTGTDIGYGFAHSSSSDNRAIQEGTIGFIPTFWQSPNYGKLQLITQYSYLTRAPWWINPTPTAGTMNPKNAHLSMVYLDIRYVLP